MKKILILAGLLCTAAIGHSQVTFPTNGARENVHNYSLFKNGTLVVDANTTLENGSILVKDGKIIEVGTNITAPADVVVYDLEGRFVYPSFFDPYSNYGMPEIKPDRGNNFGPQMITKKSGAYSWNQAIKPEVRASEMFAASKKSAEGYIKQGFGAVNTHQHDGIARGTSVVTTLNNTREHETILKPEAAANFSFRKGSSTQDYPSSLMGVIALLRQTYYDLQWHQTQTDEQNLSLDAIARTSALPQVFDARDKLNVLRAAKIGKEFGINYIIKGGGDSYERMAEVKATGAQLIVPLNFPKAYDVEDPYEALNVSFGQMKHWELAPSNPARLEKEGISFAFTLSGLNDKSAFLKHLRKAVDYGLSEATALNAITTIPAQMFGVDDVIGTLQAGKWANFIILDKGLFDGGKILENWIQGDKHMIKNIDVVDIRGKYDLNIDNHIYSLNVSGQATSPSGKIEVIKKNESDSVPTMDTTEVSVALKHRGNLISFSFNPDDEHYSDPVRLSGIVNYDSGSWDGNMELPGGKWSKWNAIRKEKKEEEKPQMEADAPKEEMKKEEGAKEEMAETMETEAEPKVLFPNMAYGFETLPVAENIVIQNATVWTSDEQGILEDTDVLLQNGKVAAIGKDLDVSKLGEVRIVDGTGKHLTPGIIDEHSHVGGSGQINEGTQASTAEVRIGDILNPDDVDIYRQMSMGTTTTQILHGSANPIGGQSALVKLRWGAAPEDMKIDTKDGFIKFALGENVKQTNWGDFNTVRFPQTRMGVEQVYYDHFIRAKEYEASWKAYNGLSKKEKAKATAPRRDIELDALVEILNKERFISCHSYIQSEINMLMNVADSMGFTLNTFTHILEGYKVADKMAKHGAGGSTFADWWGYKYEVRDAIPFNAALMATQGVTVAINSDDAEMGRRLNQEAGKVVKYGGVSQEEALKMVTLNPAKLLHIDDKVGSIKLGKDGDVVLWSANPLSIYAVCEMTIIDGAVYYDAAQKEAQYEKMMAERSRLINMMIDEKNGGGKTQRAKRPQHRVKHCDSFEIHESEVH